MQIVNTFVSYSRHDQAFVERLVADLRLHGVDIWIDRENILPGTNWSSEIAAALSRSTTLLYIITPNSLRSKWMSDELGAAVARNKRIIPVLAEDVPIDELPLFVRQIQWVDFRTAYKAGLIALLAAFNITAKTMPPAKVNLAPIPITSKGYAFISYSEHDHDFVEPLKRFLRDHSYSYWDYEESERDYHSQFFLEMEGIISEASTTLCILSESWKRSQWTVKEFFFSQEVGTPVFLLKAKPIGPTLAIAGMTFIDFTKDQDAGFHKLKRELRRKNL